MAFYGNITNRRNQFIYDKIYSSKTAMLTELGANLLDIDNNIITINSNNDDGVFIGRYVLINYATMPNQTDKDNPYANDIATAKENGKAEKAKSWDATVWQKTYIDNQLKYILIAELDSEPPELSLQRLAPSDDKKGAYLSKDSSSSDEHNKYILQLQDTYSFKINKPNDIINSAGFNVQKRSPKKNAQAKFNIGYETSGTKYHDADSPEDIIKFDIDLTEIGNVISFLYDILYSYDTQGNRRFTEVTETELHSFNPAEDKHQHMIYLCNNVYYMTDGEKFNAIIDLENVGVFQLLGITQSLLNLLENYKKDGFIITKSQMEQICIDYWGLFWIGNNNDDEEEDEIMELTYIERRDGANPVHVLSFIEGNTIKDGQQILTATVLFNETYKAKDKIEFTYNGTTYSFDVLQINGQQAQNDAWIKETIGIINFDLNNNHAYVYPSYPIWS